MKATITFSQKPQLRTERLILRPIRDDDLDALHAMLSDVETMRYWSSLPHESRTETGEWIAANRAAVMAGTAIEYGAEHQGRLIGRVILWNGNELGYIFDKAYWGQGFASEAVSTLVDHTFFFFRDWDEITADIDPRNLASGKLLQRLGFRPTTYKERTFCIGGEWSDSQYFALTRVDWLARQK
ncbi:MAG TPA: GNAT family N-acetyltransferase [Dongiaceae bacterium]|nr:GNAT family N-acetyltransferase [Dongiaceae bacterium]